MKIIARYKGGPGSGHYGHAGRPGKRGGSAPGGGRDTQSNFNAVLLDDPEIEDYGDGSFNVGLYVAGEDHSEDTLADFAEQALAAAGHTSDMGWIVEVGDVFEVDDTTSVDVYVERP